MENTDRQEYEETGSGCPAGVTKKSVSMMARNEPISMRLLDKICKELGCQVQDVIEYVPDEN